MRGAGEDCCACGAALRGIGRVCDGVGECRRAARDELRKGAHCIKVMASGGVASPTDRWVEDLAGWLVWLGWRLVGGWLAVGGRS